MNEKGILKERIVEKQKNKEKKNVVSSLSLFFIHSNHLFCLYFIYFLLFISIPRFGLFNQVIYIYIYIYLCVYVCNGFDDYIGEKLSHQVPWSHHTHSIAFFLWSCTIGVVCGDSSESINQIGREGLNKFINQKSED